MLATMILFLVLVFVNSYDFYFLRLVFFLAGILSCIEGIESYFHNEEKETYLTELGFAVLYFMMGIIWW